MRSIALSLLCAWRELRAVAEAVDEPLQVRELGLLALERVGLGGQPLAFSRR